MSRNEDTEGFQFRSLINVCWKGNLCAHRRRKREKTVIELRKNKAARCLYEIRVATVIAKVEVLNKERNDVASLKFVVL